MSTLENLRFYADGFTVRDRERQSLVLRFGFQASELLAKSTAKLLNELPEWRDKFIWDEVTQEGNPS